MIWLPTEDTLDFERLRCGASEPPQQAWRLVHDGQPVALAGLDDLHDVYAVPVPGAPAMEPGTVADAVAELVLHLGRDWSADSDPDQLQVSPSVARRLEGHLTA